MATLPIPDIKAKIEEVKTRLRERIAQLPIGDLPILQNRPKLLEGEGILFRKQGLIRGKGGLGILQGRPRLLKNLSPAVVDRPDPKGAAVEREIYPISEQLSVEL